MHAPQAQLIALDWGTSSLRAYLLGAQATVIEQRHLPWGLMQLPERGNARAFEQAFAAVCGAWLSAAPALPVIAAGMIGSAQGWREAPYLALPVDVAQISQQLTRIETSLGKVIHVIPGLIEHSLLPNVIRGEETQVIGALHGRSPTVPLNLLIGLPGTHSKWVRVESRHDACRLRPWPAWITHFDTFMTGEVYAALRHHTILGRTMSSETLTDDAAFARGLEVMRAGVTQAGLLSTLFSCRTLGLTGALRPEAQADYLSGLLIGHELAGLQALSSLPPATSPNPLPIVLAGNAALCRRYQRALTLYGYAPAEIAEQAAAGGLWQVAQQAGLIDLRLRPTHSTDKGSSHD